MKNKHILPFLTLIALLFGCKVDFTRSNNVKFTESIISKLKYLDDIDVDDIIYQEDTMSFFISNNKVNYFSEIEFDQLAKFLFQDFSIVEKSSHNHIKIFYQLPLRDSSDFLLLVDDLTTNFIGNLKQFNDKKYKKMINEIFSIDSSYGKRVEIIEILNLEMAVAYAEIKKKEPEMFGIDSMNIMYFYLLECYNKKKGIYNEIISRTIDNMRKNENYGIGVVQELDGFFKNKCVMN